MANSRECIYVPQLTKGLLFSTRIRMHAQILPRTRPNGVVVEAVLEESRTRAG